MAPRDYKHSAPHTSTRASGIARYGSWVSFASGLGIGLVVALGVYLWSANLSPPVAVVADVGEAVTPAAPPAVSQATGPPVTPAEALPPTTMGEELTATPYQPPAPKFDFYKILPEMEVPVKEWEIEERAASVAPAKVLEEGAYVLQVGSFKNFEDADRAKAGLALRGIAANVQRVVINGQDVWFRVHVGPVSDVATLRALRIKLAEIDVDFILLRLGGPAAR